MDAENPTIVARLAAHAMGTRCEVIVHAHRDATAIAERAVELLGEWHTELTRFEPGGTVWRLNAAAGSSVPLGEEIAALLARCERYAADTDGAFSVIRRGDRFEPMSTAFALMADGRRAGSVRADRAVDLGGVAKGFAFDRIREELEDLGCTSAFLHGGTSTITAMGTSPDGVPWGVRLDAGDGSPSPSARLRDRSMSVSSQHGDRPNHIVDPRTGKPATGCSFAACIGESAEETDAWSTALTVLGGRPPTMPQHLTSVIRSPSGWAVEGPDRDAVEIPEIGDPS
jgi:thiamine biosynthesis lipoprotein